MTALKYLIIIKYFSDRIRISPIYPSYLYQCFHTDNDRRLKDSTPMCLAARDGHIEVIKVLYRLGSTSINTVKVMFQMGNIHNTDARKLVMVLGAFRTSDGKLYGATEQQIIDAHNDIFFKDSLLKSLLICC